MNLYPVLVAVFSGLLLALSQVFPWLWWMFLPGVSLAILAVWWAVSWRQVLLIGLIVGTSKTFGGCLLFWYTYPLEWLGFDGGIIPAMIVFSHWFMTALFAGLGIMLALGGAYLLSSKKVILFFTFPIIWVLGEILGSFFVSVWFLGKGSYLNAYLAHGYLGLPLANLDFLLPIASVTGIYGLTYVAVLLSTGIVCSIYEKRVWPFFAFAFLLIILCGLFVKLPGNESMNVNVLAVDLSFTAVSQQTFAGVQEKQVALKQALDVVPQAVKDSEERAIVLLPEDSRLTNIFGSVDNTMNYLQNIFNGKDILVVDSMRIDVSDTAAILRAFYYDIKEGRVYSIDKQFLVAQGEYVSYPFFSLAKIFGQNELLNKATRSQNYIPGPLSDYIGWPKDIPPIIFCFESSSAVSVLQQINKKESGLVLHPISHSWFNTPKAFWYQLDMMLRTQAVWNGVNVVTAGDMVESRVYRPDGSIEKGEIIGGGDKWRLVKYDL